MIDSEISISTHQASELLGVHESSVKRWCNTGDLTCWLTPGGHRRIPVTALAAFAEEQNLQVPLRHFGAEAGRVWAGLDQARRKQDFSALVDLAYDWITKGQGDPLVRLIEYLLLEKISLAHLLDHIVGPVMRRIGDGYLEGRLSIGEEHRLTQIMRDVLVTLSTTGSVAPKSNGAVKPTAIVGCGRGEVHELGALMVRMVLLNAGWQVRYLGLDVPTEEFAALQIRHGATLVCISMMPPSGEAEALTTIRFLDHLYHPDHPYRLALGGSGLQETPQANLSGLSIPEVRLFSRVVKG